MKKIQTSIRDLNTSGQGVGKVDSGIVFIDGALPEEEVEAQIVSFKKKIFSRKYFTD